MPIHPRSQRVFGVCGARPAPVGARARRARGAGLAALLMAPLLALGGCKLLEEGSECLGLVNNNGPVDPALEQRCADLLDLPDPENSFGGLAQVPQVGVDDGRVVLNLVLTDNLGRPVGGVADEGITAVGVRADDGTEEPVTIVDHGTMGEPMDDLKSPRVSFAVVLDYSGSVPDSALVSMSRNLSALYGALAGRFESAVIHFSDEVVTIQGFTDDSAKLVAAAEDRSTERALTSLYDGLGRGIQATEGRSGLYRFVLLVTDGNDNDSSLSENQVIDAAKAAGLPIFIVGVGFADLGVMRRLARETGGHHIYVPRFNGLSEAYGALSDLVVGSRQVVLDAAPGVYRSVRLEVATPDGTRPVSVDL